ncbi:MAG: hypothetical protein BUE48_018215 [Thermomonospora sp. CIF 1]|nr:MAG: hypothetical protein BUE48_018215 [Thermomonospora sp. CIF 1]
MAEVQHFSFGILTPVLAYLMSCIGSFLGLLCAARGREGTAGKRAAWLALGAVSIGGTGIWVVHFVAMLGFHVPGMEIRYDVPLTLAGALLAVAVVGAGLFIVSFGRMRPPALVTGGVTAGLGVAGMHYLGVRAMRLPGRISYDAAFVALSVVIAIVAATAALWFASRVAGTWATMGAAAGMGVAVSGMHYTGMAAVRVHPDPALGRPSGAAAFDFLLPLIVGISVLAMLLLLIIGLAAGDEPDRPMPALPAGDPAHGPDRAARERPADGPETGGRTERNAGPPPIIKPSRISGEHRTAGRWFGGTD